MPAREVADVVYNHRGTSSAGHTEIGDDAFFFQEQSPQKTH